MPGVLTRSSRSVRGKSAATATPSENSLSSFARISKLQTLGKETSIKAAALETGRSTTIEIVLKSRKRRADVDDVTAPSAKKARQECETQPAQAVAPTPRKRKTVTFAEPEILQVTPNFSAPTISSSRKRRLQAEDNTDNASEAGALLERLVIRSPIRKRSRTSITPTIFQNDFDLPQELLDLLDLQIAFLKTLNMSFAHNGTSSPIDLRSILSSVSQSWGKRQATVDDARLLVGVLAWAPSKADQNPAPFFLSDYGRGKICIETHSPVSGPLREAKLNMDFEANLRTLWQARRDTNMTLFLGTLPKASIKNCATASIPILAKGQNQRTLMDLKNGVVRKQQQKEEAEKAKAVAAASAINADGTKMSLLDRIRMKELQQSQAAQGPSAEELMRRAALERAWDITDVIRMLCMATSSQARVAFTMAALMTKIKESLRNPISTEDAVCCVRLLAKEVAPQWMRIVTIGGRENVVLQTALRPSEVDVKERVKVLMG